jgi:LacI family transcriptional regulator
VSGKSRLIGLIISDITNPFSPELVRSIEKLALHDGFEVIVTNTGYDPERMSQCVRRMLERKADGVAIITSKMEEGLVAQFEKRQIPIVFLDTGKIGRGISNIKVDYGMGIREAVEHLFHLGHERIGLISGPLELRSAQTRRAAFMKWLQHYGFVSDEHIIQTGNHKIDGGEAAMEELLLVPARPTAVLTSNDLTAIGALRAIHKAKLRVPEDISVVGLDDIDMSELTQPALITV